VPTKDERLLATAIETLLHDASLRESFGRYSRRKVEHEFSEDIIVQQVLEKLYQLEERAPYTGSASWPYEYVRRPVPKWKSDTRLYLRLGPDPVRSRMSPAAPAPTTCSSACESSFVEEETS